MDIMNVFVISILNDRKRPQMLPHAIVEPVNVMPKRDPLLPHRTPSTSCPHGEHRCTPPGGREAAWSPSTGWG